MDVFKKKNNRVNASILVFSLFLYLLNQLVIKNLFEESKFFHYYFNDLLAPIVALSFLNLLQGMKQRKGIVSFRQAIGFFVACSVCWEWLALYIKPTSTFDLGDIATYFVGTFIYMGILYAANKYKIKDLES